MHPAVRSAMVGAGILGALVAGGATASFAASSADSATTQSDTSTTDQSTTDQSTTRAPAQDQQPPDQGQRPDFDPSQGGHTANGKAEELLTGDTATKVTEAALAAVPGATIERVETDAEGAAYEAHLVTSDGKHQTVTFDADYNVVEIQDGPGAGGPGGMGGMGGGHGQRGGAPGQAKDGAQDGMAPAAPADNNGSTSTTAGS